MLKLKTIGFPFEAASEPAPIACETVCGPLICTTCWNVGRFTHSIAGTLVTPTAECRMSSSATCRFQSDTFAELNSVCSAVAACPRDDQSAGLQVWRLPPPQYVRESGLCSGSPRIFRRSFCTCPYVPSWNEEPMWLIRLVSSKGMPRAPPGSPDGAKTACGRTGDHASLIPANSSSPNSPP